jgi:hypothetical protein
MVRLAEQVVGGNQQGIGLSLEGSSAATLGSLCLLGQPGKETIRLLSHLGGQAKAGIGRHFLPCPVPDGLIRIQVRAVGRQGYEPQSQVWRRPIFPYLGIAMRRAVVLDHDQRFDMVGPQLPQEGRRCLRVAVLGHRNRFHLPFLQTDVRIVGRFLTLPGAGRVSEGWLPTQYAFGSQLNISPELGFIHEEDLGASRLSFNAQPGIRREKGVPFLSIGFQQTLLGLLQHEAKPVQVVQAAAATQLPAKVLLDEQVYHLPVPIRQVDLCRSRCGPHRCLQLGLLCRVEDGGDRRSAQRPDQPDPSGGSLRPNRQSFGHPAPGLQPLAQQTNHGPEARAHASAPVLVQSGRDALVPVPPSRPASNVRVS